MNIQFPTVLKEIAMEIAKVGGVSNLVGGVVRDHVLDLPCKDFDIEVFNIEQDTLLSILNRFGNATLQGQSFGVLKVRIGEDDFDFSLPRREEKIGEGHKAFTIVVDSQMSEKEAARRRDLTINSMSFNILSGAIIDHFGGMDDLKAKVLRPTDNKLFGEDPLRVLRAFQMSARFQMELHTDLINVSKTLKSEFHTLSCERHFTEWQKWAMKGKNQGQAVLQLHNCEWLDFFMPSDNLNSWTVGQLDNFNTDSPLKFEMLVAILLNKCTSEQVTHFLKVIKASNDFTAIVKELCNTWNMLNSNNTMSDWRSAFFNLKKVEKNTMLEFLSFMDTENNISEIQSDFTNKHINEKRLVTADTLKKFNVKEGKAMGELLATCLKEQFRLATWSDVEISNFILNIL